MRLGISTLAFLISYWASEGFAQDLGRMPSIRPLPSTLIRQTTPPLEAQPKPDVVEDEGAFWTPDDVGAAYDLSGSDGDGSPQETGSDTPRDQ